MTLRSSRATLARVAVVVLLAAIMVLFSIAVVFMVGVEAPFEWHDWLGVIGTLAWLATFALVGALAVSHRSGQVIGWLCITFSLVWSAWLAADAALTYEAANPGSMTNPGLLAGLTHPLWVPGVGIIGLLLLLFPDGRVPTRRWRPVLWVLLIVMTVLTVTAVFLPGVVQDRTVVNPLGIEELEIFDTGIAGISLVLALIVCIALSAISVVFRYRRAGTIERLQLKWLMAAAIASALAYVLMLVFGVEFEVQLVFSLIPLAIGFAMQRHRLYDIDRLISRTVGYAVVVGVLALVFAGVVLVLGDVLPGDDALPVAASTLAVAAIFNPFRRRVQSRVDRFFHRSHYNAELVAAGFAGGLRDETDADRIVQGWVGVVSETMQPTAVGVWTRE